MASWKERSDWKARYSDLYKQRNSLEVKHNTEHRISFINNVNDDVKGNPWITSKNDHGSVVGRRDDKNPSEPLVDLQPVVSKIIIDEFAKSIVAPEQPRRKSLLEMVRQSIDEGNNEPVEETKEEENEDAQEEAAAETSEKATDTASDKTSVKDSNRESDTCVHGLMIRPESPSNESRSKTSRSQPKDIDLTSILAYTASYITPVANTIKNPEFETAPKHEERPPQWSIRRSVCPVCSQKWRDRSSIAIVKNSGLKRNSSSDFPSVVAPARLRSAIISEYTPRPALAAVDKDAGIILGSWRIGNSSWELSRARKFRAPKPQPPPDIKIPATATHEKVDLDTRVNRFLSK